MRKRRIAVVVTARPSYSRIRSALTAIRDHEKLELFLIVSGSALLKRYGSAIDIIEDDGFVINAKVFNVLEGGNLISQAKTAGLGIIELTNVFENAQPDAVISIADRYETMSTALAAAYMNIPLIHIQGGEVTGNIDEKVRHAVTKLADIHLTSTERATERVLKLGEDRSRVFNTGCPSIDIAASVLHQGLDFDPYVKYGGVGHKPSLEKGYIVVLQHPVTTEYASAKSQAIETLKAVDDLGITAFWFWPNVDAGSDSTSNALRSYRENTDSQHVHFFKNMEPEDFLKLINGSLCLLGNSSVGIRESSFLGCPVVNIGSRQEGRERGGNVMDVGYNSHEIITALESQIAHGKYPSTQIYGSGNSGKKIAEVIANVKLTFQKRLTY
jgi:UDP-hydrolysing UDP-N-acetyl-D-glucosamine 2-epimerase